MKTQTNSPGKKADKWKKKKPTEKLRKTSEVLHDSNIAVWNVWTHVNAQMCKCDTWKASGESLR